MGLGPGAKIIITKANEIIPFIVLVKEKVDPVLPDKCPSCEGEVKMDGCFLMCVSEDCPAKSYTSFARFFSRVGL